jgi:TRAP-type C4-dicarboxylate transport system permease small subunit
MARASAQAGPQAWAERGLTWLFRVEAIAASTGLALVIVALLADVAAREFFGNGLFGAQRFAVYCNSVGSLLGFALVVQTGGHLRFSLLDKAFPAAWESAFRRLADGLSAVLCLLLAYFAFRFVRGTYVISETDTVFQIRIWPIQMLLPYIFISSFLRYACFAAFPALRPEEKIGD